MSRPQAVPRHPVPQLSPCADAGTQGQRARSRRPPSFGPGPGEQDPPVQEVQLVHGSQPRRDLARHPLQQHGLRVPPHRLRLVAQVSFQVALRKATQFSFQRGPGRGLPERTGVAKPVC